MRENSLPRIQAIEDEMDALIHSRQVSSGSWRSHYLDQMRSVLAVFMKPRMEKTRLTTPRVRMKRIVFSASDGEIIEQSPLAQPLTPSSGHPHPRQTILIPGRHVTVVQHWNLNLPSKTCLPRGERQLLTARHSHPYQQMSRRMTTGLPSRRQRLI